MGVKSTSGGDDSKSYPPPHGIHKCEDIRMSTSETMRLLLEKANLVVEFLNAHPERFHPHMEVRITCDRVEIVEVLESASVIQFIRD